MSGFRYRLLDLAGEDLGIASYAVADMKPGNTVHLDDGRGVTVVEVREPDEAEADFLRAVLVLDA